MVKSLMFSDDVEGDMLLDEYATVVLERDEDDFDDEDEDD